MHHGDGANDIFRATDTVLFASIHQSWIFPGTGRLADVLARAGEGYSIDLFVEKGSDEDDRRAGRSRPRAASGNKRKPGR